MILPSLTVHAPAKLNLSLHVVGRRADGYHLLDSLVAFADFADTLTIEQGHGLRLCIEGEFADASGDANNNLVLRAALRLQQHRQSSLGAKITLTKNIPVGAGLGGGSADAAATLLALNQFWNMHLRFAELVELGAPLGADVAMCLHSKLLVARGIGDVIAPCNSALPPIHAVLVYPHVKLLSKDVYRIMAASTGATKTNESSAAPEQIFLPQPSVRNFIAWLARDTSNDLQHAAIALSPVVTALLSAMEITAPAPALLRMTGSGSCCFALFETAEYAQQYADSLAMAYPDWWIRTTTLR